MTRPPRLAAWLIARSVPADERAFLLGDFDEQFHQQTETVGDAGARRWYWREALRLVFGFAWFTPRPRWTRAGVAFMDDMRYAVRRLRHRPIAALVSIATLACAIGAAAATWSLLSAVLLNPLKVPNADRLVEIGWRDQLPRPSGIETQVGHTYPHYTTLREAAPMTVAAWGAIGSRTPIVMEDNGEIQRASLRFASYNFLDALGLQPALGRSFSADEDRRGGPLVAVLADRFWRRAFNASPAALGRTIRIQNRQVQIVGIAPRGFRGLALDSGPDVFVPLHAIDQLQPYDHLFDDGPPLYWVHLLGRLPDGVSIAAMQERLAGIRLGQKQDRTIVLTDLQTAAVPELARVGVRQFSRLLAATVGLLLAIGGLTVGMLLVLRTEARAGEFALCLALGASRRRLVAGVAAEGAVLAVAGSLLALPVSQVMFAGIRLFQLPGNIRLELLELSLDHRVLAGVSAAAVVSVLLMAVVASVFCARGQAGDALRSHAAASSRVTRRGSRTALVTAQVAVTLVLVTGTGLFARSIARALALNPGMDIGRIFDAGVSFEGYGYDATRAESAMAELADRLRPNPAIASLSISRYPTRISRGREILVDGETVRLPRFLALTGADPSYFETLSVRVVDGRGFSDADNAGSAPIALVSESLARLIGGGASVIGRRISESPLEGETPSTSEIVGVVTDLVWSTAGLNPMRLYRPRSQRPDLLGRDLTIRASADAVTAYRAVVEAVHAIDPKVQLNPLATVESNFLDEMAPQRFGMTVMGALGAIALLLSVLGTYVLAESMATRRRRELGIRAALGASRGQIRSLMLSETIRLVGAGLLLGFALAWLGASTIRAFLFQVEPFDPLVTIGVATMLVALAVAVSLRPAVSASRVDLARVLRED